jgi:hypothetical protein
MSGLLAAEVVTWPMVALALISGLPAILAAVYALLNRRQLNTGNGPGAKPVGQLIADVQAQLVTGNDKTVGEMVTEAHGQASDEGTSFPTHAPPERRG